MMVVRKCWDCFQNINAWRRLIEDKKYLPKEGAWCRTSNNSKIHWGLIQKDRPKYKILRTLCGRVIVIRKEKKDVS